MIRHRGQGKRGRGRRKKGVAPEVLEFWDAIIDGLDVFRGKHGHSHPQATHRGVAILPVKGKPWMRQIKFLTKQLHEVVIEFDYRAANKHGEDYFENMREKINADMKEIGAGGTIFIPSKPKPVKAGMDEMHREIALREAAARRVANGQ